MRWLSLFLACQHLNWGTNLREREVPVLRFDWCKMFSRTRGWRPLPYNMGASTSHKPMGLHGLIQGQLYLLPSVLGSCGDTTCYLTEFWHANSLSVACCLQYSCVEVYRPVHIQCFDGLPSCLLSQSTLVACPFWLCMSNPVYLQDSQSSAVQLCLSVSWCRCPQRRPHEPGALQGREALVWRFLITVPWTHK
jgi:hypothetical protein